MRAAVLLLNVDYVPSRVIQWERAIELLIEGKAVSEASVPGKFVRSAGGLVIPWPSIIRLARPEQRRSESRHHEGRHGARRRDRDGPRIKFSTGNTLARDNWTCAYCGVAPRTREGRPDKKQLSFDHVVPRSRKRADGQVWLPWIRAWRRVTCWENGVCACRTCNGRKGDRLPDEAGMTLRVQPRRPTYIDVMRIVLVRHDPLPAAWRTWIPEKWGLTFREEDTVMAATG